MGARPNAPEARDPRGLSKRERRVAAYVALGESNKLIAYRLGLAQSTVSEVQASATRKLGATSRAELIQLLAAGPTTP